MTQGNPFSGNPNTGTNPNSGNPFEGDTTGRGTGTSADTGTQSTNPARTVVDRGAIIDETEQGNPFSPNRANVGASSGTQGQFFGDTGAGTSTPASGSASGGSTASNVDIYLREADLAGNVLNLRRANAADLSVSLAPLVDGVNTDTFVQAFTISQAGLVTLTNSGTNPQTFTAQIDFPDATPAGARSGILNGTTVDFYSGDMPSGTPLFSVDLSALAGQGGLNTFINAANGVGTDTIVLAYNDANQASINLDMTNYLNSEVRLALNDLTNVTAAGVDGDVLTFDSNRGWVNASPVQSTHLQQGIVTGTNVDILRLTLTDLSTVDVSLAPLVASIRSMFPQDTNRYIDSWTFDDTNNMLSMTYNDGTTPLPPIDLSSLADLVTSLASLSDVTITNPADSQVLVLDNNGRATNRLLSINDLLEVDSMTTHEAGEILIRNAGNTGYEARQFVINDAADVNTAGATSGQVLRFNGSQWLPFTLPANEAGGITVENDDASETAASQTVIFDVAPALETRFNFGISTNADGDAVVTLTEPAPDFAIRLNGVPSNTPVIGGQTGMASVTVAASTGTLDMVTSFTLNGTPITGVGNVYTFTRPTNVAGQSIVAMANGTNDDGVMQMARATGSWEVFIPYYSFVGQTQPTAISQMRASSDSYSVNDTFTASGNAAGDTLYVAAVAPATSNPVFMIGEFQFVPNMVGTLNATGIDGTDYTFNLYNVGTINGETRQVRIVMA